MLPKCFLKQKNLICSLCTHAIMKLLALSCNRWNFFPLSLFGDKVNGFLKGRVDRVAELARLVPSSWLLIKLWVWIGMV